MSFTIYLNDEDGGERGQLEGETVADCLDQLDKLDGCDAMEAGCRWLGSDSVTNDETSEEIPITFGANGKYHLV